MLVLLTMIGFSGLRSIASPNGLDYTLDVPVYSSYVLRGMVLNDQPVLQPSLTAIAQNGLSLSLWANMDLTSQSSKAKSKDIAAENRATSAYQFSEVDPTITYKLPVTFAEINVGYVHYFFPNNFDDRSNSTRQAPKDTGEFFGSIGRSDWYLQPKLTVYWDIRATHGTYANFSIHHGWDITDKFNTGLGASIGGGNAHYNLGNFGVWSKDLVDGNAIADATYKITKSLSIGASIQYTIIVSEQIRDAANESYGYFNNGDQGIWIGAARMTYNF